MLISLSAFSAPKDHLEDSSSHTVPIENKDQTNPLDEKGLKLIEQTDSHKKVVKYYRHPAALAFEFGPAIRLKSPKVDFSRFDWILAVQIRQPSNSIGHWEMGFEVFGSELGGMELGYRLIFDYDRDVRPQVKLAVGSETFKGDKVNDFFAYRRMVGKAAFALETFAANPKNSFRLEIEAVLGLENQHANIKFGWTWPL